MRYALSGSALLHAGLFGTALLSFAWPQPEDAPAPGAVTVDIVTMATVSTNVTATLDSMSTQDQVSAGAEAVQSPAIDPVQSETLAPVEPAQAAMTAPSVQPLTPGPAAISPPVAVPPASAEPVQPVQAAAIPPARPLPAAAAPPVVQSPAPMPALAGPPETVPSVLATLADALDPAPLAPLAPGALDRTRTVKVVAAPADVIEPVAVSDAKSAPVPQTLSFTRPSAPTPRPATPRKASPPPPAQAAGNGGTHAADTAAGRAAAGQQSGLGGGGAAEIAPWERQVRRKLASAQRYPRAANGASGDVLVSFTVLASGALSGLRIQVSSGNPVLDQAALDTVARAAPFPPIPAGAGLASKAVAIPLGFVR